MLADIPGLIEGAHEGAGLGDRFLGHVERCRVLLHLVDGTSEHAGQAYRTVREELDAYGHGLAEKPEIVALSKADALDPDDAEGAGRPPEAGGEAQAVRALRRLGAGRARGSARRARRRSTRARADAERRRGAGGCWQP